MNLELTDWVIIGLSFAATLAIGLWASKSAGKNSSEFFLSGQNMPWWLLGVSMVATTFSADTPNLVTDIVRKDGIAGNWVWWAFLLTGMLTVFVYAKLWRKSGVKTDLGFYTLRYSGKEARFLRYFRSIYLGVFFNVAIMATVLMAGIKMAGILLGINALQTILLLGVVTVFYSSVGGFKGVVYTDFFQFIIAMIGTVWAAIYIVNMPEVGGLNALVSHELVQPKLDFIPAFGEENFYVLFFLPIAVQWWSVWYPGAEPGGGGYLVQRMLASKDENHALKATFFFNIAHYALRPWPWILVALASLVVFPNIESIQAAFPAIEKAFVGEDLAYPAMLSYLPKGLLGLVIASLIAAVMSTLSTHLNWGASYVVYDVYKAFKVDSSEKELVLVGRLVTVGLMVMASVLTFYLQSAKDAFDIILSIGTGTGLIFILRWFWWRINAYTEITGMVVSFLVALYFMQFAPETLGHVKLLSNLVITSAAWLLVTLLTRPTDDSVLQNFYETTKPPVGWSKYRDADPLFVKSSLGKSIFSAVLGCFMVYGFLFGMGYLLLGSLSMGIIILAISIAMLIYLLKFISNK